MITISFLRDGLVPVSAFARTPITDDQFVNPAPPQLGQEHHMMEGRQFLAILPHTDGVLGCAVIASFTDNLRQVLLSKIIA